MKLRPATDEEKRARDRLTHAAWGRLLTPAGFAERESRLRAHPWAQENMTTWLLAGDGGEVLASCETFRMESRLPAPAGGAHGSSYGVASVFTAPEMRHRGHAARLLGLLVDELPSRDRAAQASILFSEVGASLYARCGYVARPAFDLALRAAPGEVASSVDALVTEGHLAAALATVAPPPSDDGFIVWPTAAQLDWQLERERAYAALLGRARPPACGALAGDSAIFWAADFKKDRLAVLLFYATSAETAEALVLAAQRAAAFAALPEVRLWEAPRPPYGAWPLRGATRTPRSDALPMIRPLASAVEPASWTVVPRALWI